MEFTHSEASLLTRQQDLIACAETYAKEIVDCDEMTAQSRIDELNMRAVKDELVLSDVVLTAAFVMRTCSKMSLRTGQLEVLNLPDDSENVLVGGAFVGFEAIRYKGGRALMYRLETGFDPDVMSFYAASIPVEGSRIAQRDFESDEKETVNDMVKECFDILSKVEGDEYKELLDELVTLIVSESEVNEDLFMEIGNIVEEMLLEPEVGGTEDMELALIRLISSQIDPSAIYFLHGQSFIPPTPDKKLWGGIDEIQAVIQIGGVQLISDYYIDKNTNKLVIEETQQPAFTFSGQDGIKRIVPLKHLIELSVAQKIDD